MGSCANDTLQRILFSIVNGFKCPKSKEDRIENVTLCPPSKSERFFQSRHRLLERRHGNLFVYELEGSDHNRYDCFTIRMYRYGHYQYYPTERFYFRDYVSFKSIKEINEKWYFVTNCDDKDELHEHMVYDADSNTVAVPSEDIAPWSVCIEPLHYVVSQYKRFAIA